MDAIKQAFKGFDVNDLDLSTSGNWPIGVKIISYLIVIALIVAAGWHFYAVDKQAQLHKEVKKEKGLKSVYKEKAFQVSNLDALRKQMEDVEERFAELKKQLPTEKEVPGLLDDITNLGTDSGLDIGSIALASEKKKEFYIELPININVAGSYHQMGQFVSGIAALPRIVTLHDYSISPSAGGVNMRIHAKTYRYDETK
ncbi:type 4a pilus biogenesis protein PilO [Neptuniibacter sp.]|uniref:type 4a pilus biogenesis protein PilO n=1 Tax=Neptuniibacter sp. TaxID=1962643 RepID=UPI002607038D|nr:type 4a pilus biogenesis protein PilO [Neptuniibacter sp.]MCP4596492.1 type 4a pilus biogenesis protein PilO [Neptuniibacter sp.]